MIIFKAELFKIGSWVLLRLPKSASIKLPSRGMTAVQGVFNDHSFNIALEPDGKGSHWFRVNKAILDAAEAEVGETIEVAIEPLKEWPEPKLPEDLKEALSENSQIHDIWKDLTSKARWDWIRWIRSTKNEETRRKRIKQACSMLASGKRRPCCFNRNLCTEPDISKSGILLDPTT